MVAEQMTQLRTKFSQKTQKYKHFVGGALLRIKPGLQTDLGTIDYVIVKNIGNHHLFHHIQ